MQPRRTTQPLLTGSRSQAHAPHLELADAPGSDDDALPPPWRKGKFSTNRAADAVARAQAEAALRGVMHDFEALGVSIGIRRLVECDEELSLLLRPRRPGTIRNHVRMWRRYKSFLSFDLSVFEDGPAVSKARVLRWFRDLMSSGVGANTLSSGMVLHGML